jgi:uncharacterized protein (TIGR02996 family)
MTHDAFLQAIIESPDDDAPRLVYADWLDDHGDADRAVFIRAQCALARFYKDDPFDGGVLDWQLAPHHREAWLAQLTAPGLKEAGEEGPVVTFTFRRGFVESLHLAVPHLFGEFLACAPDVFRLTPLLHLRLWLPCGDEDSREGLAALLALPQIGHLRTLDFHYHQLTDGEAGALLASPPLPPQTHIRFRSNALSPDVREALESRFGAAISLGTTVQPGDDDIPF